MILAKPEDKENYKQYGKILSTIVFFMSDLQDKSSNQKNSDAALRTMFRNLTVLSQLANIKDGEDMAKLLESSALPIGSSSIKRSAGFNIALNTYVGFIGSLDNYRNSETKANFGLSAPIGLAFSWSNQSNKKRLIASNSIFLSALDLGTLINYRLQNSNSEYSWDGLKFKYFQCYGINWMWNFRKSPISVYWGAAFLTGFREIKVGNESLTGNQSYRFNTGILVDIPVFNILTSSKSKLMWK